MQDAYSDDLSDFIRHGRLDGYELTDEELARFLEVWRWTVWTRRSQPSGPDFDVVDAVTRLQTHLDKTYGVEVEYNTLLLLRQELEPLMYWRVLANTPRALFYFLRPRNLLALIRGIRRTRRYRDIPPVMQRGQRGYPASLLDQVNERAPDLLKRKYWMTRLSFERRHWPHLW